MNNDTTTKIATILMRPIRVGYIINREISSEKLDEIINYNTMLWGAYFNIFIPTNGIYIREDWWKILIYHDPDIIIYVGELSTELKEEIYERILPFENYQWDKSYLDKLLSDEQGGGISIWTLFNHLKNTLGQVFRGSSRYVYPTINELGIYQQFYKFTFGLYTNETTHNKNNPKEIYFELLNPSEIIPNSNTLPEHLELVKNLQEKRTPINFASSEIKYVKVDAEYNIPDIIISSGLIDDLFLYHIVRWTNPNCIFVQEESFISNQEWKLLADYIKNQDLTSPITIASLSLSLDKLKILRENLRGELYSDDYKPQIALVTCNIKLTSLWIFNKRKRQQLVTIQNDVLTVVLPEFDFQETTLRREQFVTDVFLSQPSLDQDGFAPSIFRGLNHILSKIEDQTQDKPFVRIARGALSIRSLHNKEIHQIYYPDESILVREAIESSNYVIDKNENKGRYIHSMVRLAGGISELQFFRLEYILRLFYEISNENERRTENKSFQRKVRAYTLNAMKEYAKPGKKHEDNFENYIRDLSGKKIFFRGHNLTCPECNLTTWYQLNEVAEWVNCKGCHTEFQMHPQYENFAYQLNQLFLEGLYEGGASVLLTIYLLKQLSEVGLFWQCGYKIQKDNNVAELDIIAMCDGMLILTECKNSFVFNAELEVQLRKNIEVAKDLKANIFIFSTLSRESVPDEIVEIIRETNEEDDNLQAIILDRKSLLTGEIINNDNIITRMRDLFKPLPDYPSENCYDEDD